MSYNNSGTAHMTSSKNPAMKEGGRVFTKGRRRGNPLKSMTQHHQTMTNHGIESYMIP